MASHGTNLHGFVFAEAGDAYCNQHSVGSAHSDLTQLYVYMLLQYYHIGKLSQLSRLPISVFTNICWQLHD